VEVERLLDAYMGSYCSLSINGINIYYQKNKFSESHLKLFSPLEFTKYKEILDGEEVERILLRTTVKKAKTRLEILGCNLGRLEKYFIDNLEYQLSNFEEDEEENYTLEEEYYRDLTLEEYTRNLKAILETSNLDIRDANIFEKHTNIDNNSITIKIITSLSTGRYLNPFFWDWIYENEGYLIDEILDIYICLISCNEDSIVEYDLTDATYSGYIEESKIQEFYDNFKDTTIIIPEGKTDIKVLSKSLEFLFPEYKYLFTFFDFDNFRADGGTSYLSKLLKSFSAAKINNRIIAIFDNDTAAEVEIQALTDIPISKNIRIMKLPTLDFCDNYPTIGPTGINNANVNGFAVSIELFFGEDIIKENNEFHPIQWTNYNDRLRRYQGSITNKSEIIVKMEDKLRNPNHDNQDWSKLIYLWETIFKQNT